MKKFIILLIVSLFFARPLFSEEPKTPEERINYLITIIDESDKRLEENKKDVRAYYDRGNAHYYLGIIYKELFRDTMVATHLESAKNNFELAIEDFTKAEKYDPTFMPARIVRGMSYGQLGLSASAIADFSSVIAEDPGNAQAYYARGREYWEVGEYEKAKLDYDKACELDPQWKDFFYSQ